MRGVLRSFVLPFMLGIAISLSASCTYWCLEWLLADHADYDRGLWEGGVLVMVIILGQALARLVLKRFDAWRQS
jgi:hypothetical protein